MAIDGFDYKQFSKDLTDQASGLVPAEFDKFQKDYIVKTLANFSNMAGEAISNDADAGFNADQAILLTQIIAEWSFHKSVDIIRSGIQPEYWDGVMQKIAFTIFDIGKQAIKQNLPQEQILELVEHHVLQAYQAALDELLQRGIIDENLKNNAAKQNNLNQLVEQVESQQQQETAAGGNLPVPTSSGALAAVSDFDDTRVFKLASLALLLNTLSKDKVSAILNKFDPHDAQTVIQYMQMPDLTQKVDTGRAIQCLKEIKTTLPDKNSPAPNQLCYRIKNALKDTKREKIELLIKNERINVKKFVMGALSDDLFELPPKISNLIAQHIESSV